MDEERIKVLGNVDTAIGKQLPTGTGKLCFFLAIRIMDVAGNLLGGYVWNSAAN